MTRGWGCGGGEESGGRRVKSPWFREKRFGFFFWNKKGKRKMKDDNKAKEIYLVTTLCHQTSCRLGFQHIFTRKKTIYL